MLIDTHCHLNMMIKKEFNSPLPGNFKPFVEKYLKDAAEQQVTTIINVGTSLIESTNSVLLATTFPALFATLGTHPNDLTESWKTDIQNYKNLLQSNAKGRIVGIGEIGLDYHYPDYHKQRQYDAFHAQIELALTHSLPIVVHTRDAQDETLHIIEQYKNDNLQGVIHCFSETASFAEHARSLGFFLGIGGTLTYPKNESLREIFKTTPLTSIVLETDAPFLPPQWIRGKQNSPSQINYIAHFLADLKGLSFEEVATQTTHNARQLFMI